MLLTCFKIIFQGALQSSSLGILVQNFIILHSSWSIECVIMSLETSWISISHYEASFHPFSVGRNDSFCLTCANCLKILRDAHWSSTMIQPPKRKKKRLNHGSGVWVISLNNCAHDSIFAPFFFF